MELTSATGNARFFTRASWRFDFDRIPEGMLVTCTADFAVRLRYFLLAPILFVMRRAITGDLEQLKRLMETERAA